MDSIKEKTSMAIHSAFSVIYRRIYKLIFSKRKSQTNLVPRAFPSKGKTPGDEV